jgi:DNA-binding response OmpR family regulator
MRLLIVEDDRELLQLLASKARAEEYEVSSATTVADALRIVDSGIVQVALVDLALGAESGLDVIRRVKERCPDVEIIVVSATTSVASAIESYELNAFAFVQKPFDLDQLFKTIDRAIERRRMNLANRRLVWELQLINEIGDDLRRSLDPRDLLKRALQRLTQVLETNSAAVRLQNPITGAFEDAAAVGPDDVIKLWPSAVVPRPSDQVLRTRKPVCVGDLAALVPPDVARVRIGGWTDPVLALFAGIPAISLVSMRDGGFTNYHLPSDTPDRVDWDSVEACLRLAAQTAQAFGI